MSKKSLSNAARILSKEGHKVAREKLGLEHYKKMAKASNASQEKAGRTNDFFREMQKKSVESRRKNKSEKVMHNEDNLHASDSVL